MSTNSRGGHPGLIPGKDNKDNGMARQLIVYLFVYM